MYQTIIPVMVTSPTYDHDRILADLRAADSSRVFLAIPPISTDEEEQTPIYDKLGKEICWFRERGVSPGVWFWSITVKDGGKFQRIHTFDGKQGMFCCPLDENFLGFMEREIGKVASLHPDLILFDDDFRYSFWELGYGCNCPLHMARLRKQVGEDVDPETLYGRAFSGKPNGLRSAYLRVAGDALREYAARVRRAVDRVDPAVRFGVCACNGTYDVDGTDSFEISRILAGGTRPFLRFIGAPYWARHFGNSRLTYVIELERLQAGWCAEVGDGIEHVSEGDAYPRPRYRVPASYLQLYDTALRADGGMDGIMKYMFDYTSSADYERGYLNMHVREAGDADGITAAFAGKTPSGIRVYEPMKKVEEADLSHHPIRPTDLPYLMYPDSSRFCSENAVPTVYRGTGCAGIVFGESARHLPEGALSRPLVIDLSAARILREAGVDVGISSFGGTFHPTRERYEDGEFLPVEGETEPFCEEVTLNGGARVVSWYRDDSGREVPASAIYRNAEGQNFFLLCCDAHFAPECVRRNYCRPRAVAAFLKDCGTPLPAFATGAPDLYLMAAEKDGETALGIWNCHADALYDQKIALGKTYSAATFHRAEGKLAGDTVTLAYLPAFSWCWLTLKK